MFHVITVILSFKLYQTKFLNQKKEDMFYL